MMDLRRELAVVSCCFLSSCQAVMLRMRMGSVTSVTRSEDFGVNARSLSHAE